jgi:hypothetical protein
MLEMLLISKSIKINNNKLFLFWKKVRLFKKEDLSKFNHLIPNSIIKDKVLQRWKKTKKEKKRKYKMKKLYKK